METANETASEVKNHARHCFSTRKTALDAKKKPRRWTRSTQPSIRSKLLQKAFAALGAKLSATNIHGTKATTAAPTSERRGRYSLSRQASTAHATTAISTKMRK